MWVLLVVRLLNGNGDMMLSQEFMTEQNCKTAAMWIVQQEKKSTVSPENILWTCMKK